MHGAPRLSSGGEFTALHQVIELKSQFGSFPRVGAKFGLGLNSQSSQGPRGHVFGTGELEGIKERRCVKQGETPPRPSLSSSVIQVHRFLHRIPLKYPFTKGGS